MKVRELIEILAKKNWDAQIKLDLGKNVRDPMGEKIRSVSSFVHDGRSIVILNIRK